MGRADQYQPPPAGRSGGRGRVLLGGDLAQGPRPAPGRLVGQQRQGPLRLAGGQLGRRHGRAGERDRRRRFDDPGLGRRGGRPGGGLHRPHRQGQMAAQARRLRRCGAGRGHGGVVYVYDAGQGNTLYRLDLDKGGFSPWEGTRLGPGGRRLLPGKEGAKSQRPRRARRQAVLAYGPLELLGRRAGLADASWWSMRRPARSSAARGGEPRVRSDRTARPMSSPAATRSCGWLWPAMADRWSAKYLAVPTGSPSTRTAPSTSRLEIPTTRCWSSTSRARNCAASASRAGRPLLGHGSGGACASPPASASTIRASSG